MAHDKHRLEIGKNITNLDENAGKSLGGSSASAYYYDVQSAYQTDVDPVSKVAGKYPNVAGYEL